MHREIEMKYLITILYKNITHVIEDVDLPNAQKHSLEWAYENGYDPDDVQLEEIN